VDRIVSIIDHGDFAKAQQRILDATGTMQIKGKQLQWLQNSFENAAPGATIEVKIA
jgi:hypothetical protein